MHATPSLEERAKTLTIFGRKPVLEALSDDSLSITALHVASSNKPGGILNAIRQLADARGIRIREHDRDSLSRISKNKKQDQGVALDISCPNFGQIDSLYAHADRKTFRALALDGITNPQNVGMIIRSAVAGGMDAGLDTGLGEELRALRDPPSMEAAPLGMQPVVKFLTALNADRISGL